MKPMILVLSLFCSLAALADELPKFDVLNVGTKTYRGVKVTAIEPSGIRFTHDSGAARAKFEELDAETRAKFTFDPAKAKEFEADREHARVLGNAAADTAKKAADEKTDLSKLKWENKTVKIWKAVPGGYLCYFHSRGGAPGAFARATAAITGGSVELVPSETHYDKPIFVSGIKEAVAIGQILDGAAANVGVKIVNGQPVEHWMSKP